MMLAPPGYRDVTLCGSGATSRVFRAIDARTGHAVALKRLHRQLLGSAEGLARLKREFDALSRLRHPGLVAVRDVMRWQGDPTVVMDFIPGQDLDCAIAEQGPLNVDIAMALAKELFEILAVAHGAGIVHRDVKPQNVRLGEAGQVHLLDFGSARFDAASQLTAVGTSIGTPDYMAPELFAGSVYDPRVDVYGVGATLYKALTGQVPQVADSLTELAYRRTKEPVLAIREVRSDVPQALAQVIDRCLQRAPEARFSSCALAIWALEHPQAERAFQERRRNHPPCLHCDAAIAPASTMCPRCGSDHPFVYTPGFHHVELHNAKRPEGVVSWVSQHFSERTRDEGLRDLSERLAGLDTDSQRLVSFIDESQAQRIATELEAEGVHCEVLEDQGTAGWKLYGASLALFVSALVVFGHVMLGAEITWTHALLLALPSAAALGMERLFAVTRASQGILSSGRYPAAIVPNVRAGLLLSSGGLCAAAAAAPLAGTALLGAGFGSLASIMGGLTVPLLTGAVGTGVAALVAWSSSYQGPFLKGARQPEPRVSTKLAQALSVPQGISARRLRTETAVVLTASVLALVPLEIVALGAVSSVVPSVGSLLSATVPTVPVPTTPGPISQAPISADPVAELPAAPQTGVPAAPAAAPAAAPEAVVAVVPSVPWQSKLPPLWSLGLSFVMGLGSLGLILHIRRRRRRVLGEAARIELDLRGLSLGAGSAPLARLPEAFDAPDRLAVLPASDGFLIEARTRAADLAHCLDTDATERLRRALEDAYDDRGSEAEDGLLARSIGPSDPEQRLRFDLLALEGELEASAATVWWDEMSEGKE